MNKNNDEDFFEFKFDVKDCVGKPSKYYLVFEFDIEECITCKRFKHFISSLENYEFGLVDECYFKIFDVNEESIFEIGIENKNRIVLFTGGNTNEQSIRKIYKLINSEFTVIEKSKYENKI